MEPDESPLEILRTENEQINPAIILAERLMRREAAELLTVEEVEEAESILDIGVREIDEIESHRKAFHKSPASAMDYVPMGF